MSIPLSLYMQNPRELLALGYELHVLIRDGAQDYDQYEVDDDRRADGEDHGDGRVQPPGAEEAEPSP